MKPILSLLVHEHARDQCLIVAIDNNPTGEDSKGPVFSDKLTDYHSINRRHATEIKYNFPIKLAFILACDTPSLCSTIMKLCIARTYLYNHIRHKKSWSVFPLLSGHYHASPLASSHVGCPFFQYPINKRALNTFDSINRYTNENI